MSRANLNLRLMCIYRNDYRRIIIFDRFYREIYKKYKKDISLRYIHRVYNVAPSRNEALILSPTTL